MPLILVVDDETDLEILIKQKFRKEIRNKKYEFLFAINGKDALDKIKAQPTVDIVLSDINMPEMDGLTLLSKLNEVSPLIKSVIVSAYGDMDNIRTAMNRGAFDFITKPINFDDLSITIEKTIKYAEGIKQTLKAIQENNILKMYVDESVLNFMNSSEYESILMDNETIEGTVLFVDVCGFTRISETAPANTVVKLLNAYFDVMVKEIIIQDGCIDKFIGDGVMAVFRGDYHLDRAIDSALKVREQINMLPAMGDTKKFKPKVAIGINSGEMISGNTGSVSLKRLDYTVIGDVVNTAARFQEVANEDQIIISENCYEKINESFRCNKLGSVPFKNKEKPIIIYEVIE
jgi:adenylate cyclase